MTDLITNNRPLPTLVDRLIEHFRKGYKYELSQEDKEIFERWNFADNMLRRGHTPKTIVGAMREKWDNGDSTFYRDIQNAKKLFGSLTKVDKDYEKMIMLGWLNKAIRTCFLQGNMRDLKGHLQLKIELLGLTKEDSGDLTPDMLGGNTYVINLPGGRTIDIDSLEEIDPEIIEDALVLSDITELPHKKQVDILTRKDEK